MDYKEFYAQHVDQTKFYTIKELEVVMEQFRELNDGSVPGGPWLHLTQLIGSKMVMEEEIYEHFGEEQMLKIIKNNMDPIFEEFDYTDSKAPLFGHTFGPIQNILSRSAKLNYQSIYNYMTDNVNLMNYDIDRMDLAVAIKYGHTAIIERILDKTDENYGTDGVYMITVKLQQAMQEAPKLHDLSNDLKIRLAKRFDWLNIDTITGKIALEIKIEKWENMSDGQLKDLIDNKKKGQYTDEEFDALKKIMVKRLKIQLAIVERQLELENMK